MSMIKPLALAALLATAATTVHASPFNANISLDALSNARSATVLSVNQGEARSLSIDVDTAALQQRIKNNRFLSQSVMNQGYSIDQIVGIDASDESGSSVTLYAL